MGVKLFPAGVDSTIEKGGKYEMIELFHLKVCPVYGAVREEAGFYSPHMSDNSLNQKAGHKIFVCKLSNVKSKLYNIENSKTRVQTVQI